ncbi:Uncharacterized protein dnm_092500 [Desulfonema magnum]|uniref:Uncharacterized protein n=1 Tax=Desulfonema magnum TaxID=45655 RepID=A0A975BXK4_9BACT|nr:Uncharacterized protein dnm_092500 [Desulfonema magnum]
MAGASPESVIISTFFSANGGETRLFLSGSVNHFGKKTGFFPGQISKTYG